MRPKSNHFWGSP